MLLIKAQDILPITLQTVKDYWRIEFDDDDDTILRCLKAGIVDVELSIERDIITRQWEQSFCNTSKLQLDRSPLISVDVITVDGSESVDYTVDAKYFTRPVNRPVIHLDTAGVETSVVYTTGMESCSPVVEQAVLYAAGLFYHNREAEVIGTITSPLKLGYTRLLNKLKAGGYF